MLTANCPLPAGWWLVESEDKQLAWFPAPYLELCDEEEEEEEEGGFLGGESLFITWTGLCPEPPEMLTGGLRVAFRVPVLCREELLHLQERRGGRGHRLRGRGAAQV